MALTKVTTTGIADDSITSAKVANGVISAADVADGSITNAKLAGSIANDKLAGSIANAKLANSAVTINGSSVSLGGSATIAAGTDWQAGIVADGSTVTTAVADKGYFIDNIQLISWQANCAKGTWTNSQLVEMCKRIAERH